MDFFYNLLNIPCNKNITTNDRCANCDQKFNHQLILVSANCDHSFHTKCINDRKITHCPQCRVATADGMHQIEVSRLTTKPTDNSMLAQALIVRDFHTARNIIDSHRIPIDIDFCESILLEDIINLNKTGIINMLQFLDKSLQYREAEGMLKNILTTNPNKNYIANMFITNFPRPSLEKIALNHYIEQKNFKQAEYIIKNNERRGRYIDYETFFNTLAIELTEGNIDNINSLFDLIKLSQQFHCREFQESLITLLNQIILDLNNPNNLNIIETFLNHKITTPQAIKVVCSNYYRFREECPKIKHVMEKNNIAFTCDSFKSELQKAINANNIDVIIEILELSKKNDPGSWNWEKFNKIVNDILNQIVEDYKNIKIVEILLAFYRGNKVAINVTTAHYLYEMNIVKVEKMITKYNASLIPSIFELVLKREITNNNIVNIKRILTLLYKTIYSITDPYKPLEIINKFLKDIIKDPTKTEIFNTILKKGMWNYYDMNFFIKYYIVQRDFIRAEHIVRYTNVIPSDVFLVILTNEIEKNNIKNIELMLNLLKSTQNSTDDARVIYKNLSKISENACSIEVRDAVGKYLASVEPPPPPYIPWSELSIEEQIERINEIYYR